MKHIGIAIDKAGGPVKMAAGLGVSVQSVYFWRSGKRGLPIEHGASIERLTDGAVTRKDLWPDSWHRIWPELATPDAICEQKPAPALDGQALGAMAT
jgi:DNA-binding transcriptional regulator YdaS (Cro superfamily)